MVIPGNSFAPQEDETSKEDEISVSSEEESCDPQSSEETVPNIIEVEITLDNFDTYFEYVEYPKFVENEFGEADQLIIHQGYLLREEYGIAEIADSAVEYRGDWGLIEFEVDFENQTYVLGERTKTADVPAVVTSWKRYTINGKERRGFLEEPLVVRKSVAVSGEGGYYFDIEILRVQGTLKIIEE